MYQSLGVNDKVISNIVFACGVVCLCMPLIDDNLC